jgi:hypothetical protein
VQHRPQQLLPQQKPRLRPRRQQWLRQPKQSRQQQRSRPPQTLQKQHMPMKQQLLLRRQVRCAGCAQVV